jgi:hypothetical protein
MKPFSATYSIEQRQHGIVWEGKLYPFGSRRLTESIAEACNKMQNTYETTITSFLRKQNNIVYPPPGRGGEMTE